MTKQLPTFREEAQSSTRSAEMGGNETLTLK
jgi:hypothetical protein